jgi:hypothetical protein
MAKTSKRGKFRGDSYRQSEFQLQTPSPQGGVP